MGLGGSLGVFVEGLPVEALKKALLLSRLNKPSSLSLSSQERCSSHLLILVALRWTLSSSSSSFLKWGAQNWTQCSRWGLTRAVQRGRRTSLNLLATLLLMHPRIPLAFLAARAHCWPKPPQSPFHAQPEAHCHGCVVRPGDISEPHFLRGQYKSGRHRQKRQISVRTDSRDTCTVLFKPKNG